MVVWLFHGAMGLSAVCDCGISGSYFLTIFAKRDWVDIKHAVCCHAYIVRFSIFEIQFQKIIRLTRFNFRSKFNISCDCQNQIFGNAIYN